MAEEYVYLLIIPVLWYGVFWVGSLHRMRLYERETIHRFSQLPPHAHAIFREEAFAYKKARGFYCGELGVWMICFTPLPMAWFTVQLPYYELAAAAYQSGRLYVTDCRGRRFRYFQHEKGPDGRQALEELRLHAPQCL